jgi:RimJ/RimL family protein N-acetyltransferase
MVDVSEVRLRPIVDRDVGWMLEVRNKPENLEHLRNPRMISFRSQENWWKRFQKDWDQDLLIIERKSHLHTSTGVNDWEPVGVGGITHIEWLNRSGEMSLLMEFPENTAWALEGLKLLTDYGHGVLNLHRLWVECYTEDRRALFVQSGFQVEGRKVDAVFRYGKYEDGVLLSLLQKELPSGVKRYGASRELQGAV